MDFSVGCVEALREGDADGAGGDILAEIHEITVHLQWIIATEIAEGFDECPL